MTLAELLSLLPATTSELYGHQVLYAAGTCLLATLIANVRKTQDLRHDPHARIDAHYIFKNMIAGGSLPVALLLISNPWYPASYNVLSGQPFYLSVSGMVFVVLSVFSLIKR